VLVPPARHAQFGGIVYDPTNYAQNVLTAARTLEQINNQITSLQNEAQMLINQARNLASLPYSVAPAACSSRPAHPAASRPGAEHRLRRAADRPGVPAEYGNVSMSATDAARRRRALRWQNTVGGLQDAMRVQAGVVGNIDTNRTQMSALVGQSQGRPARCRRRRPATSFSPSSRSSSPT
jgi:conjugal transfer/entry exclusion protein